MHSGQYRRWGELILLFLLSTATAAQMGPGISVTGEAEVRVIPDEVIVNVGVETADKDLNIAKRANDAAIARAMEIAKRHGIAAQHLQTDYIQIQPRYQNGEPSGQFLGYVVRKSLTARLREIAKFESLLSEMLQGGINIVHGVEFRTTELRKHRDQARALAIKAAQEKAEALTRDAGRKVGRVLSISEHGGGWYSAYGWWWGHRGHGGMQNVMQNAGGGASVVEGSVAPGQIMVTAQVGVTFALE